MTLPAPWRICPGCGCGPGEDHKGRWGSCPESCKPPVRNYSSTVRVTRIVKKRKKVRRKK